MLKVKLNDHLTISNVMVIHSTDTDIYFFTTTELISMPIRICCESIEITIQKEV